MPLRDPLASPDDSQLASYVVAESAPATQRPGLSLGAPRNRASGSSRTAKAGVSSSSSSADDAVRQTDSDALWSRLSALRLGYLAPEPYTQEFATAPSSAASRRSPLINIGTYLRCTSIDAIVDNFLVEAGSAQIVSIGAGSDSRYWRVMSSPAKKHLAHYLEIDFAQNTRMKLSHIGKSTILRSLVHDARNSGVDDDDSLSSANYSLRAADVRDLHPSSSTPMDANHVFGMLDPALPTLVLFECVLSYIDVSHGDHLIEWLTDRFPCMQAVVYDIGLAGDKPGSSQITRFGRVMLQNLEARNLSLSGASAYPSMSAQSQRFSKFTPVTASSLLTIWQSIDVAERIRLSRLEGLDEVEELEMLLRHYYLLHLH